MKIANAVFLFLAIFAFSIVLVASVSAEVLVFDKYDTVTRVSADTIRIEREMTLTNVARNPVIPGELHFKLYQEDGSDRVAIPVSNLVATNERGQQLSTKIVNRPEETSLAITVWDPLLPGFSYTFRTSYEMKFEPSGILFYELKIPREDTTIPIKQSKQTVLLEPKYHVTYAPDTQISKLSGNTVVSWSGQTDSQVIEYSNIPLPRIKLGSFSVRAVNFFWGIVILCLLGLFVMSVNKQKKLKERNELEKLESEHKRLQQSHQPPHQPPHQGHPPQGPSGG